MKDAGRGALGGLLIVDVEIPQVVIVGVLPHRIQGWTRLATGEPSRRPRRDGPAIGLTPLKCMASGFSASGPRGRLTSCGVAVSDPYGQTYPATPSISTIVMAAQRGLGREGCDDPT